MRELERAGYITRCVDVLLAGLEILVDADPALVVVHTGLSQVQPRDLWVTARRDQEKVGSQATSS
jgi:hypothetical protein